MWDLERRVVTATFEGHGGWVWSLEGVPSHGQTRSVFASGGTDGALRLWDGRVPGGSIMHLNLVGSGPVAGLYVRECGTMLATGTFDGLLRIFDIRARLRELARLPRVEVEGDEGEGHQDRVTRIVGRGDVLLSASFDSTVRLWDFGLV